MTPLERIEQVLDEMGIKKPDLQKKLNILSQHWNNWKLRGIPPERMFSIAAELNLNTDWIASGKGEKYRIKMQDTNAETAPNLGIYRDIPVVGTAQLGDNGNWYDLEYPTGHGDGYIKYPSKDQNAYALRCIGDSMKPRIRSGEFVIVEPNSQVVPGDEVLVKANDGRVMVKTFLYERDERIYLQSLNESHPSISLALKDIAVIHLIAAIAKNVLWEKKL